MFKNCQGEVSPLYHVTSEPTALRVLQSTTVTMKRMNKSDSYQLKSHQGSEPMPYPSAMAPLGRVMTKMYLIFSIFFP